MHAAREMIAGVIAPTWDKAESVPCRGIYIFILITDSYKNDSHFHRRCIVKLATQ